MARKAGPGDGAEDAPEGRGDVSPAETGFLPDARVVEDSVESSGLGPSEAGEGTRVESLSEEGLGATSPGEAMPTDDSRPPVDLGDSPVPEGSESAAPEDWRPASLSEEAPTPSSLPPETGLSDAASAGSDASAPDPWRSASAGERSGSEPLLLTTPVPSAEDLGRASEPQADLTDSRPSGASFPPVAPPPPPRRRGGFGALLLGGMIAAALGFGAAWLAQDRLGLFPARLPAGLEERLAALEARPVADAGAIQGLTNRLAEAEARLTTLEEEPAPAAEAAPPVDLEPLRQEIGAAEARAAGLEERIAALEARPAAPAGGEAPLGSLSPEAGPAVAAPALDPEALRGEVLSTVEPRLAETEAGLAEVRSSLSETRDTLDQVAARLDRAEAGSAAAAEEARAAAASLAEAETRASTAEAQARARAALGEVEAALDAGAPFQAPLSELEATGVAVPESLARLAPEGAPTLTALRAVFPEAARSGLAAARDQGLVDGGGGMWSFVRSQFGVRSITPREGEDPDAVLSRAEARLAEGNLDAALAEVGSLPEPVRAAMADWIAQAETRAQADAALAGLRGALPAPDASPAD